MGFHNVLWQRSPRTQSHGTRTDHGRNETTAETPYSHRGRVREVSCSMGRTIQNDSTYVNVIEDAFGAEVDFAQLHKVYRAPMETETRYSPAKCIGCPTPRDSLACERNRCSGECSASVLCKPSSSAVPRTKLKYAWGLGSRSHPCSLATLLCCDSARARSITATSA